MSNYATLDGVATADAETVDDALTAANETVSDALAQTGGTVEDTLARANETVANAIAPAEKSVNEAVAQTDQTVSATIAHVDKTVDDTLGQAHRIVSDTLGQAQQTTTRAEPARVDAATGGPPPAADAGAIVAPKGGDASPTGASGSGSEAAAHVPAPPADDLPHAGPLHGSHGDVPFGGDVQFGGDMPFGGDVPLTGQSLPDSALGGVHVDGALAGGPPPTGGGGTALDAIVTTATDPRLIAATGVAVFVGGGVELSRGVPHLADSSLVLTNVRLLPCLIRDGLADHVGALTAALTRQGSQAAAHVAVPAAIVPPRGAVADASALNLAKPADGGRPLTRFGTSFRDGFRDAVDNNPRFVDTSEHSRLMIQLAMVLGFVYATFVSIWFSVMRPRRSSSA